MSTTVTPTRTAPEIEAQRALAQYKLENYSYSANNSGNCRGVLDTLAWIAAGEGAAPSSGEWRTVDPDGQCGGAKDERLAARGAEVRANPFGEDGAYHRAVGVTLGWYLLIEGPTPA